MDTMPEARLTKNRFRSVRAVLIEVYPQLKEIPKETLLQVLLDSEYLSRRGRLLTMDEEKKTKVVLAQQFVVENVV